MSIVVGPLEVVIEPGYWGGQTSRVAEHLEVGAPGESVEKGVTAEGWGRGGQVQSGQNKIDDSKGDEQVISFVGKMLAHKDNCCEEKQKHHRSSVSEYSIGLVVYHIDWWFCSLVNAVFWVAKVGGPLGFNIRRVQL